MSTDFERALLCIYNKNSSKNQIDLAQTFLMEKSKDIKSCWELSKSYIFSTNKREIQATFWCLQFISNIYKESFLGEDKIQIAEISFEEREDMKKNIFLLIKYECKLEEQNPIYVKNKLSELLIKMYVYEFSKKNWDDFFDGVFSILSMGEVGIDFFLRIFETFHVDCIQKNIERTEKEKKLYTDIVIIHKLIKNRKTL
jgi:hypothetical protein